MAPHVLSKTHLLDATCGGGHAPAACGALSRKGGPSLGFVSVSSRSPSSRRFKTLRSSLRCDLFGRKVTVREEVFPKPSSGGLQALPVQMSLALPNAKKWWEQGLQSNMKEISSAQNLVDSLLDAGEKLVIVDFFSPGCGGCRALHPKICQIAKANPEVMFLQVNYEEHKSMCYSLNVHVLPFFRFYRGAHGRLCSFSCTNATIKKFKDAMAKHGTERCSLEPTKGLEESELLSLAANKDLSFTYKGKPEDVAAPDESTETIPAGFPAEPRPAKEEKTYVTAWR